MADGAHTSIVLIHRNRQGQETTIPVEGDELQIGRSSSCDVCIASQFVSRRHAQLKRRGDGWVYQDLDSTSGSYLHGMRVREMPLPFPPEPFRTGVINLTRRSLDRADRNQGKRDLWLRLLDGMGLGFDS